MLLVPVGAIIGASGPTFRLSHESTTSTITIPASCEANDLAVCFNAARNFAEEICVCCSIETNPNSPTKVLPSGFTELADDGATDASDNTVRVVISYKELVSGDINASRNLMNGDMDNSTIMLFFRPNRASPTWTPNTWDLDVNTGNPGSQTVLSGAGTPPLIVFGFAMDMQSGANIDFSTQSPSFQSTIQSADGRLRVGYTIYNTGPQNQTVDCADNGSYNGLGSGYIRVS